MLYAELLTHTHGLARDKLRRTYGYMHDAMDNFNQR